ncbi:c-type cytochrome biogenesis protein CcsB [Pengzhenrongella sicca]|uniref:C-type cytochrome biogenesis protein CcsB n=1 Tax=Pengzhenrongella sicca TaxID=2819238 RepID=A0A8A4ZF24_9MICO|nr:c-type cytochrome biogenesis protein CcsB [Pengzhenrongella sicca]QTE29146.1 c-type cytochrome biogenesis protein CcsB [Pengzhenrongella sicca]
MTLADAADLSTKLVWSAATVYTVALVAYSIDLARVAEHAGRMARTARAAVGVHQPVAAGGASAPAAPASPGLAGPAGRDGARRRSKARGIARTTTMLGLVLQAAAVVLRGIAAGRTPWANMYEFALVGSMVAIVVLLVVLRRRDLPFLGVLVTGLTVLALALALLVFFVQADGVQPALDSYWIVIHVGVAITATGVFTVAFAASVLQLLKGARDRGSAGLSRPVWRWLETVPRTVELEALSFRLNAIGFVLWTFTVIAGAIWAEHTWGRYWGWDPKEVWSFVVWVVYAAYLHARTTRGWSGSRAAWFVLIGYGCVLANFTLVNLFFSGKHAYSGL